MNTEHKDKVKRWKIAIQHFNFDVLHIEGKQNIEADTLSRLVPFPSKQDTQMTLNNLEQTNIDKELSDIVKILNHRFRGHKKTLSNLELQLVWEDDPNPDWFPWK